MDQIDVIGGAEPLGLVLGIMCVFFMAGTLGYFALHLRSLIAVLRRGAVVASPVIPALAIAGIAVAGYLGYVRLAETAPVCGPLVDCGLLQTSTYAAIMGVPVAFLGLLANLGCLALWWMQQRPGDEWAAAALLLLAVFGTLVSVYLTAVELFVLRAVCPWCLLSAMLFTGMVAAVGLLLLDQAPRPNYFGD
ncbi:MAG: vitamin K epoxide reductase family protein [Anaerolineae bacterium]|nr:vitamin K epoxide reductase family protein [Anaerolineae bacterium]